MFRCKRCGYYLTKEDTYDGLNTNLSASHCPTCYDRVLEKVEFNLQLTNELKALIDIAFNFGVLMSNGEIPNYSDYDYYEELVKMTNKFLNTPADKDILYVEAIDRFANDELRNMFGGVMKYDIIDYWDVWGNEQEGFDVNDSSKVGSVNLASLEDVDIIETLKEEGYLSAVANASSITVEGDDIRIELSQRSNGYPLCALVKVD